MASLFWDSCVFNAFLYDETDKYNVDDIAHLIEDAKKKRHTIYASTIYLAEVRQSKIKRRGYGTAQEFFDDLSGACVLVEPSPNVMILAGQLRDIRYKKHQSDKRDLKTPDAIMLASALHLRDILGVTVEAFHIFDDTKKKEIPLLSYHEWCEDLVGAALSLANRVCSLKRCRPEHEAPRMPFMAEPIPLKRSDQAKSASPDIWMPPPPPPPPPG